MHEQQNLAELWMIHYYRNFFVDATDPEWKSGLRPLKIQHPGSTNDFVRAPRVVTQAQRTIL